jgi:hypothetical protein
MDEGFISYIEYADLARKYSNYIGGNKLPFIDYQKLQISYQLLDIWLRKVYLICYIKQC